MDGLETPVMEVKNNASISRGEMPADVRARQIACCPNSSAFSIQISFACPQRVMGRYSSSGRTRVPAIDAHVAVEFVHESRLLDLVAPILFQRGGERLLRVIVFRKSARRAYDPHALPPVTLVCMVKMSSAQSRQFLGIQPVARKLFR